MLILISYIWLFYNAEILLKIMFCLINVYSITYQYKIKIKSSIMEYCFGSQKFEIVPH